MNQDDIIRVAREAGFAEWYGTDDPQFLIVIEHFAALVAAHEREECLEELIVDYEKPIHKELPDVRAAGCSQAQGQQNKKCEAGPSLQDLWDCWDATHGGEQKPVAYMKQWPPGRWEQCSENYAGACPVYLHPAPIPGGWQLVNLNMTPEQRQLMLRADEFTVDEMWILLLAAAPKYKEQSK